MKRIYMVNYYKNFGNTYWLRYVTSKADFEKAKNEGYERITRKEAIYLASAERYRRNNDYAFSGYASESIYPWRETPEGERDMTYWDNEPAEHYPYIVD